MGIFMQINDILVIKEASFGFPLGQEVTVLGMHDDGPFVSANGVSKLVSFETVEAKQ